MILDPRSSAEDMAFRALLRVRGLAAWPTAFKNAKWQRDYQQACQDYQDARLVADSYGSQEP